MKRETLPQIWPQLFFKSRHFFRNPWKKSIFRPIIFVNDIQSQIQILERVKAVQAGNQLWQHLSSLLLKARANLISKLLHRNILQARLSRKVYWNETFVKMWEIEKCRDVCFNQGPGRFIKEGPDQKPNLGSDTWPSLGGHPSDSWPKSSGGKPASQFWCTFKVVKTLHPPK